MVVTDVVFFGLKKVMPLMTEGLLQFPSLASQYFSLVRAKRKEKGDDPAATREAFPLLLLRAQKEGCMFLREIERNNTCCAPKKR